MQKVMSSIQQLFKRRKMQALFFACISFLVMSSCHRNTDCIAVIKVVDDVTGNPVMGAKVVLWANINPQGTVADSSFTGASGTTTHKFKLPAIFDIDVTATGKTGKGIIQLEIGETVDKTVRIQ